MKKFLAIAILSVTLLSLSSNSYGQGLYYGLKAGLNVSSISNTNNAKPRGRALLGMFVGYQITDSWAVQVEGMYSWQGGKTDNGKLSMNYIKFPVLAKLYLIGGLNIESGISFNILTTAKQKFNGNSVNLKGYNGFDCSIPLGVNYLFLDRFEVGARYDFSLTRLGAGYSSTAANRNFAISLAFRF